MKVERVDSLSSLRDFWNEVLESAASRSIFQTFEWVSTWWDHFGDGKRPYFLVARDGREPVGIAPLFIDTMRVKGLPLFRVMRFVASGPSDYLDFILKSGYEDQVLEAFVRRFLDDRGNWDLIWLSEVPEASPTNRLLPKILSSDGLASRTEKNSVCPYIDLPDSWEQYTSSLGREVRKGARKKLKRLSKAGQVGAGYARENGEIGNAMADFFSLHEKRWSSDPARGHGRSEAFKAFHADAAAKLSEFLDLSFLKIGGRSIASMYCYEYGATQWFYLQGMDPDYSYYSPCFVLTMREIEDAIGKGLKRFDFMRGDEAYKYHFTKTQTVNSRYLISHSKAKLGLYLLIRRLSRNP